MNLADPERLAAACHIVAGSNCYKRYAAADLTYNRTNSHWVQRRKQQSESEAAAAGNELAGRDNLRMDFASMVPAG